MPRTALVFLGLLGCAADPRGGDVPLLRVQRECGESKDCYCRISGDLHVDRVIASAEAGVEFDEGIARLRIRKGSGECALFRADALAKMDQWGDTLASFRVAINVRDGSLEDFEQGRRPALVLVLFDNQDPPGWRGESEAWATPGPNGAEAIVAAAGAPHDGQWRLRLRFVRAGLVDRLVAR